MLFLHRPLGKALFYSVAFHGGLLLALQLALTGSPGTKRPSASAAPAVLTLAILPSESSSPPNKSTPALAPEKTEPVLPTNLGQSPDMAHSPAPESSGYFPSSDLDTLPQVVQDIPEETGLQLAPNVGGTAIIRLYINEAGTIDEAIIEETDFAVADMRPLMRAFQAMRFSPGRIGQAAVKSELRIEIRVKPPVPPLPARARDKWH